MKENKKRERSYPSDLTDTQWAEIEPLYSGLREYTWPKRELTDAGRDPAPSYGLLDSQSVKTVAASEERGIDGGKKRKGASGTSLST